MNPFCLILIMVALFSMHNSVARRSHHSRALAVFGLIYALLWVQKGAATEFVVGQSKGWTVPTDSNAQGYSRWAESNRFLIGDSLVFNYAADQDSVLQVSQDNYNNCNTTSPIQKFSDGHTLFKFDRSGPYYFISGNKDGCLKNEKLEVVVLADRSGSSSNSTTSPSPSPPEGTIAINPSPNGASGVIVFLLGNIGAFAASVLMVFNL